MDIVHRDELRYFLGTSEELRGTRGRQMQFPIPIPLFPVKH